ncbi:MAG: nitroreductase family protein [Spirochaetaceae bacterium]
MQEIIAPIRERRARRALDSRPVPPEVRDRILEAATFAPSCFNNQPWRFLVLDDPEALSRAKEFLVGGNYWAERAPLIIGVVTRNDLDCRLDGGREYAFFGCGLAVENLLLQATAEGLIAHPIAGFKAPEMREAFDIDESFVLLTLIIVGYPGSGEHLSEKHRESEGGDRSRKPMGEVVFLNSWRVSSGG